MRIALDKNENRIDALDAEKGNEYYCPVCGEQLTLRKGYVKVHHFAHRPNSSCTDAWHYDMSWWHTMMQNHFSKKYQEVVLTDGDEKHRADVLIDGFVLEFQHSPITYEEFSERNIFYKSLGYRVVWIFDLSKKFARESITDSEYTSTGNKLVWKRPISALRSLAAPQDMDNSITICFFRWENYTYDDIEEIIDNPCGFMSEAECPTGMIYRFQYTPILYNGDPNWKHPRISTDCGINIDSISDNFDIENFFYTTRDFVRERSKKIKVPYKLKRQNTNGFAGNDCVCPRRGGKQEVSHSDCENCRCCALIFEYEKQHKEHFTSYCCYPNKLENQCSFIRENG